MKKSQLTSILVAAFAVTAALAITGCATTGSGYKQADKTGKGMAEFRDEVIKAQTAINNTVAALDAVAQTAATDPRKSYEKFSKQVDQLESAAAKLSKRSQDMQASGDTYFKQWEAQMAEVQSADIKALADKRRAELQAAFANIRTVATPLKAQFDPWLAELKDLRSYLGQDLTVAGVDAAKKPIAKAQKDGVAVKESMDKLVAELNSVYAALTPAKVEPKKTEPAKK